MISNILYKLINLNINYFIKNEVKTNEYFFAEYIINTRRNEIRRSQINRERNMISLISILSSIIPILIVYLIFNYLFNS